MAFCERCGYDMVWYSLFPIFTHTLSIALLILQKDGFEVEFEAITDENGKLKAQNVTSSDGKPCPGPDPKDRRGRRKKANKKSESGDEADAAPAEGGDEKKSGEGGDDKNDNTNNKEGGKKGRNRRRRKNGAKKAAEGNNNNDAAEGGASTEDKKPKQKNKEAKQSWYNDLEKSVQESLEKKDIKVDAGRAFLAISDARIKLGTGGYAALAHATGILAEGKYTCDAQGKVAVTWENVLKHDTEWKVSSYEAEKASLLAEFTLTDGTCRNRFILPTSLQSVETDCLTRFSWTPSSNLQPKIYFQILLNLLVLTKQRKLYGEKEKLTQRMCWKVMVF